MKNLYISDLELLLHLFVAENHHVDLIDPAGLVVHDRPWSAPVPNSTAQRVLFRTNQDRPDNVEYDVIIEIGDHGSMAGYQRTVLHVVNAPQGGMRWLYPPSRLSSVLHFHNAAGFRGKLIAAGIDLAAKLGLDAFVRSGSITIHHRSALKIDRTLNAIPHAHRTIFMGTPGAQRKMGLVLENENEIVGFVKVATAPSTRELLHHEQYAISVLSDRKDLGFIIPNVLSTEDPSISVQSSVRIKGQWRSTVFTSHHAQAVVDLCSAAPVRSDASRQQISARLSQLSTLPLKGVHSRLLDTMKAGLAQVSKGNEVPLMPAHGDFTPWNILCDVNGLSVYDWEMYQGKAPALYDLIHFHMQQHIIVDRSPFKTIRERINEACELPVLADLIGTHKLDIDQCIIHYLLASVSYFLEVYSKQEAISETQNRQLLAWEDAFVQMGIRPALAGTQRDSYLQDLQLNIKGSSYALLKYRWNTLEELPTASDLDMVVDEAAEKQILSLCRTHPFIDHHRSVRRSFMTTVEIHFKDHSYLSLDLIRSFKRKHLTLLSAREVLHAARQNESGLMLPAFKHDLAYTFLFHHINGAPVPEKYQALFNARTKDEWQRALAYLSGLCDLWFIDRNTFWKADPSKYQNYVMESVTKRMSRTERFTGRMSYLLDTARGVLFSSGFIVTFSGVDGAGKSTVIGRVKDDLATTYRRKVILMRHRPGLLPMLNAWRLGKQEAETLATNTRPRQGTNTSVIGSALRFSYYYMDYLLGQCWVYLRHITRGHIVLYDRYYFDFMADPRRSNLNLNTRVLTALYALIQKPRINFFLYADSSTILARKQELTAADVENLTDRYKQLFDRLSSRPGSSRYISIRNEDLEVTLKEIRTELSKVA